MEVDSSHNAPMMTDNAISGKQLNKGSRTKAERADVDINVLNRALDDVESDDEEPGLQMLGKRSAGKYSYSN